MLPINDIRYQTGIASNQDSQDALVGLLFVIPMGNIIDSTAISNGLNKLFKGDSTIPYQVPVFFQDSIYTYLYIMTMYIQYQ